MESNTKAIVVGNNLKEGIDREMGKIETKQKKKT